MVTKRTEGVILMDDCTGKIDKDFIMMDKEIPYFIDFYLDEVNLLSASFRI